MPRSDPGQSPAKMAWCQGVPFWEHPEHPVGDVLLEG